MKYITVTVRVIEGGVFTPAEIAARIEGAAVSNGEVDGVLTDVWDARDPGRSKQAREFDARVQGLRP